MTKLPDNSVQIPLCALAALAKISDRWGGISRDKTVRRLLENYVELQERLLPNDRLTHISTVMGYPSPAESHLRVRLRVRLDPQLATRARAVAFLVPGQTAGRVHPDYRGRPLTDAMMTAIAAETTLEDDMLRGLLPRLRQEAARGLWSLAVASTLTVAESRLLSSVNRHYLRGSPAESIAQELIDGTHATWHGDTRRNAVRQVARELLVGDQAEAMESLLWKRNSLPSSATEWSDLYDDYFDPHAAPGQNWEARGGAAIWRAKRILSGEKLRDWINGQGPQTRLTMGTPGWTLHKPAGWRRLPPSEVSRDKARWDAAVAQHQVLKIDSGSGSIVWPVQRTEGGYWAPVPELATVFATAAADRTSAVTVVEALLTYREPSDPVRVPAYTAHRFGFITRSEADTLLDDAHQKMRRRIRSIIDGTRDPDLRKELEEAMNTPTVFREIVRRRRHHLVQFEIERSAWPWEVISLADEVLRGLNTGHTIWLTRSILLEQKRRLAHAQYDAGLDAHRHSVHRYR